MQDWIVVFAAITAVSATGFVVVAVMWLRKLRETVSISLAEAANQQVRSAQRLGEALAQVQKQQSHYDQQLQNLAQAGLRLRQELVTVNERLENHQADIIRGDSTLH